LSTPRLEGRVIQKSSRNIRVETADEVLLCTLRGKFRDPKTKRSPVVVGDLVVVSPTGCGEGVLEEILPRRTELRRARALGGREGPGRRRPSRGGKTKSRELVVAANVDQVLLVLAAIAPAPKWSLVDRVLISAEFEGVDAGICLNKWDQTKEDPEEAEYLEEWLDLYRDLGYTVFQTSAIEGDGVDELRQWLEGKMTVLSGHSGVGKSTLLNALDSELDIQTGAVNRMTGKGRHTTTAITLYKLGESGYLVDTPGYREYGLLDLEPPDVSRYYREFRPLLGECRFTDCIHVEEPQCAILAALEAGKIDPRRYGNYLQILESF
jgi:ribosome biogenesis GTPase